MAENKKEDNKSKRGGGVFSMFRNLIKTQSDINDKLETDIYGVSKDIKNAMRALDDDSAAIIAKILKHNSDLGNGDFIRALEDMYSNISGTDKTKFDSIKKTLEESKNVDLLHDIYQAMSKDLLKYEDLRLVSKLVPQINEAIMILRDSIASPDDVSKQVACTFKKGDTELVSNKDHINFTKKMKNVFKEKNRDKLILNIIENTLVNGKQYCAVIPYERAFTELLSKSRKDKKKVANLGLSESELSKDSEYGIILESAVNQINDMGSEFKCDGSEINAILNNITISEGIENLYNEELINEATAVKNSTAFTQEEMDKYLKGKKGKTDTVATDGTMDINSKDINISTDGCIIKELDIRYIIPVKIDNICLGYYYIENNDTANMIKTANSANSKFDTSLKNAKEGQLEVLYKGVCDLLVKKLDKKIIETNPAMKETFYEMLKYHDAVHNKLKITYLRPDEVVEFKVNNGVSVIEPVLFFAKLYLALLLTNVMLIISRGNDMRAYYIKSELDTDIESMVNNVISELKKESKSILNLNHVPKLLSVFTKFTDLFIPMDADGGKPIDFDIIQGQDTQIDTELMQKLDGIITNGLGVPSTMINASNEVDFARTLELLNSKYVRRSMSYQIDLNPSITEFDRKLLLYEIPEYSEEIAELVSELQPPMGLLLQNHADQMNNVDDIATRLSSILLGENNDNPKALDLLKFKIVKYYCPNMPWEIFIQFKDEVIQELVKTKEDDKLINDTGEGDESGMM